jgi:hypothetical protein
MQTLARALEQAPLDAVVLSNYARVLEESGGDAEQAISPPPVFFCFLLCFFVSLCLITSTCFIRP